MVQLKVSFKFPCIRLCSVSIPYGTIKSLRFECVDKLLDGFQFLMVQLKALTAHTTLPICLFQFLMVQLKVYHFDSLGWRNTTFQFLMVQLKDFKFSISSAVIFCFNSLWYN